MKPSLSIYVFPFIILIISACSPIQSRIPIELELEAKKYDKKSNSYVNSPTRAERLTDKKDDIYLRIFVDSSYTSFSAKHIDEYLYFIDLHAGQQDVGRNRIDHGDAHAFSELGRTNMFTVWGEEKLLGMTNCLFGECEVRKDVFYDSANVDKLRKIIEDFGVENRFSPPQPNLQTPSSETAIVYMYRLNTAPLAMNAPVQIANKQHELPRNRCFWMELDPGEYEVNVDWGVLSGVADSKATFKFEKNQLYFIKYSSSVGGPDSAVQSILDVFYDRNKLKIEPRVVAQHDIQDCEEWR